MPAYPAFRFEITGAVGAARTGRLTTPHGVVETPNFIFCATKGAMKGLTPAQLREAGADIILSNTYHLFLRPGPEWVARAGGLHRMLGWDGPMLTDSGGFQIFSLGHGTVADEIKGKRRQGRPPKLSRITEEGAAFKSYIDGSGHLLTPELSIRAQRDIGADLVLVLDECTPFHVDRDYTARSMELSHRWALRSLAEFERGDGGRQALYGIVQGGVYPDLREASARFVATQPFFGQAIGGSLGGDRGQMRAVVAGTMPHLHPARPVHLLGIGNPADVWNGVALGIDTFDCVHPSRLARHGGALAREALQAGRERLNLRNARFRAEFAPLEPDCGCYTCRHFTRAYLHYLIEAGEMLAGTLVTLHNVAFMTRMLRAIRAAIAAGRFEEERRAWIPGAAR